MQESYRKSPKFSDTQGNRILTCEFTNLEFMNNSETINSRNKDHANISESTVSKFFI